MSPTTFENLTPNSVYSENPSTWDLRPGLTASLRQQQGEIYYVIEDRFRGDFFRLGRFEWEYLCYLHGTQSPTLALQKLHATHPDCKFDEQSAEQSIHAAIRHGMLKIESQPAPAFGFLESKWYAKLQQLAAIRVPLGNPDRIARRIAQSLEWVLSPLGAALWVIVVIAGSFSIWDAWSEWIATLQTLVRPESWFALWGAWLVLKIMHELGHAVSCVHFGGRVGESGFTLMLFVPVAFVDVTSSWRFRSRWARIVTSAAGMAVELFLAGIAALVWRHSESDVVRHACYSFMISASISTLLFNLNPLAKFDGYYILSDLWEVPNLSTASQSEVMRLVKKWFLGVSSPIGEHRSKRSKAILAYGIASMCWRGFIVLSLTIGAAYLFGGIGIGIALGFVVTYLFMPAWALWQWFLQKADANARKTLLRRIVFSGSGAFAVAILPWPFGVHLAGIVDFSPLVVQRTQTEGFVEEVVCQSQGFVREGDELVRLRNRELESEWTKLQSRIAQAQISLRSAAEEGNWSRHQQEQAHLDELLKQSASLKQQLDALTIRAKSSGLVLTDDLSNIVGSYVEPGHSLLTIGDPSRKVIVSYVPEHYLNSARDFIDKGVAYRIQGRDFRSRQGRIDRMDPVCTSLLEHAGLGAHLGGPLPVIAAQSQIENGQSVGQVELTIPRHRAFIELDPGDASALSAGELAIVSLVSPRETVFMHLSRIISKGFSDLIGKRRK